MSVASPDRGPQNDAVYQPSDSANTNSHAGPWKCQRGLLRALTTRQTLYIVIMHSIGAGILDAAINFGIAVAMYRKAVEPISLFALPKTIAGDTAITVLVQGILTWVIDAGLVYGDIRKGMVAPLPAYNPGLGTNTTAQVKPGGVGKGFQPSEAGEGDLHFRAGIPLPSTGLLGWFFGGPSLDIFGPGHKGADRFQYIIQSLLRGLVLSLLVLPLAWGISVSLACALWPGLASGNPVGDWPAPQIYKGVSTFFLGAITTPISTFVAMAKAGADGVKKVDKKSGTEDGRGKGPEDPFNSEQPHPLQNTEQDSGVDDPQRPLPAYVRTNLSSASTSNTYIVQQSPGS
ncbi:hypothetical protein DFS34DRAFT_635551 [Phlyctochytrium arcticum]|nr:hypothetical protein DFS34DRAFT_635551 [Phlyctochytrium arcticum]